MKAHILFPVFLLFVLAALNLLWGSADLNPGEVCQALFHDGGTTGDFIVREIRLPQTLAAIFAGAAIGTAGLVLQTVFDNPLADPSLLGVNAGAGLGAGIAILLLNGGMVIGGLSFGGYLLTVLAAGIGALAVITLLIWLSAILRDGLQLLIAGVMVNFAAGSIVSALTFYASAEGVQGYALWGMGDLSGITSERLPAFFLLTVPVILLLFFQSKPLNALLLGEDYASNLGIGIKRARTLLLGLSGILCADVTALCGPIGFIGLTAPHIARFVHRTSHHRHLIPLTALWGSILLTAATLPSRLPGGEALPPGIVTPLFGVPVVFLLLTRRKSVS